MKLLFENGKPSVGLPPSEEEFGEALLWGCKLAVNKLYRGAPPASMSKDDIASEIIEATRKRCLRWRTGGPVPLNKFCYVNACKALFDWIRKRNVAKAAEMQATHSLLLACADFVIYEDEKRLSGVAKGICTLAAARARDAFEDIVTLEDFNKVF